MSKKVSPTAALEEIGRRAMLGDKLALDILRELSIAEGISAQRRNLAAKLFVNAGGRP